MTRFGSLLLLLVCCAGCETSPRANYERLNLINAGGTVTLDGNPLPQAVVSFDDPTDSTFSYGLTDANGRYRLQFDSEMKGVKPGGKVVRISTTRKILGLNSGEEGESDESGRSTEQVPEKYNKKSQLTVDVTPAKSTYDFDLKSSD